MWTLRELLPPRRGLSFLLLLSAPVFLPATGCFSSGTEVTRQTVTVACGRCIFEMEGAVGCPWAAEIEGEHYLVSGTTPQGLLDEGIYKELAIALQTSPHRAVSLALVAQALGATKSIDERRIRFALGATQDQRKSVPTTGTSLRLDDAERDVVMKALAETGYNIKRAAKRLGIARSTLYDKISRYEIDLDQARRAARSN